MEAAARAQPGFAGPVYSRRQPEKTALYQVLQRHLLTFEQQWTDEASGRTLVPPPKRHLTRYFGVLSSHAASRSQVVPATAEPTPAAQDKPTAKSRYIPWADLLRRTFGFEIVCTKCKAQLRLIALVKTEVVAKKILTAMHVPADVPDLHPARPPPQPAGAGDDWVK